MDLSYRRFEAEAEVTYLPPDVAVLLARIVARQVASPTARVQSAIDARMPLAGPLGLERGAFHGPTALWLARLAEP